MHRAFWSGFFVCLGVASLAINILLGVFTYTTAPVIWVQLAYSTSELDSGFKPIGDVDKLRTSVSTHRLVVADVRHLVRDQFSVEVRVSAALLRVFHNDSLAHLEELFADEDIPATTPRKPLIVAIPFTSDGATVATIVAEGLPSDRSSNGETRPAMEPQLPLIPNVFLVGVPKSGTTAAFDLLCRHANVGCTEPKEVNMLSRNYSLERARVLYRSRHLKHVVRDGAPTPSVLIDGSITNSICPQAPVRLKELNPESRVLIMCRVSQRQRILSLFKMTSRLGREKRSLEEALKQELDRIDRCLPAHITDQEALQQGFEQCVILSDLVCDHWENNFNNPSPEAQHYITFGAVEALLRLWRRVFPPAQVGYCPVGSTMSEGESVACMMDFIGLDSRRHNTSSEPPHHNDHAAESHNHLNNSLTISDETWGRVHKFYQRMGGGSSEPVTVPGPSPGQADTASGAAEKTQISSESRSPEPRSPESGPSSSTLFGLVETKTKMEVEKESKAPEVNTKTEAREATKTKADASHSETCPATTTLLIVSYMFRFRNSPKHPPSYWDNAARTFLIAMEHRAPSVCCVIFTSKLLSVPASGERATRCTQVVMDQQALPGASLASSIKADCPLKWGNRLPRNGLHDLATLWLSKPALIANASMSVAGSVPVIGIDIALFGNGKVNLAAPHFKSLLAGLEPPEPFKFVLNRPKPQLLAVSYDFKPTDPMRDFNHRHRYGQPKVKAQFLCMEAKHWQMFNNTFFKAAASVASHTPCFDEEVVLTQMWRTDASAFFFVDRELRSVH